MILIEKIFLTLLTFSVVMQLVGYISGLSIKQSKLYSKNYTMTSGAITLFAIAAGFMWVIVRIWSN